jgi:sensor c-di-GMP phosphodiesterase-like protein
VLADTICRLGRGFGMTVIAEGVERPEQADAMARIGCDAAQGDPFARPMPLEDMLGWLAEPQPATPMDDVGRAFFYRAAVVGLGPSSIILRIW